MDTIVINRKMYEVRKIKRRSCAGCMYNPKECSYIHKLACINNKHILVRRIYFLERIMLWFNKKMNK